MLAQLSPAHSTSHTAGPVCKIRLLGDAQHNSKIAFVEFVTAESAKGALKLSGALLGMRRLPIIVCCLCGGKQFPVRWLTQLLHAAGTLPLRISPSKTPVRVESRRTAQDRPAVAASMAPSTVRSDVELDPSLLMAVAGLQLYPFTAAYQ
jgi:hypothetical protein